MNKKIYIRTFGWPMSTL